MGAGGTVRVTDGGTRQRVAAIDCGTNSIRLLVADLDPASGRARDVVRRMEIVRLGQGVDRTGAFAPEALDRTIAALAEYAAEIRSLGAARTRMVATSATRDASNRDVFVDRVTAVLGVPPDVISGREEAELSFAGATVAVRAAGLPPPYLVFDIGGGSTEFVLGADHVQAARSVDVGCVRLSERHFHHDPPTPAEQAAALGDAEAAIGVAATAVPFETARTLVGVAGTVTTIAGMILGLPAYDAERIHLSRLAAEDVRAVTARLLAIDHTARAAVPVMHPGRVDVIAAGATVLRTVVDRVGLPEVVASEHDILDGIAWSLA